METNWVHIYYGPAHEIQIKLHRTKQKTITDIYSHPVDVTYVHIQLVSEITTTTVLFTGNIDNQNLSAASFFSLGKNFYPPRFLPNNIN